MRNLGSALPETLRLPDIEPELSRLVSDWNKNEPQLNPCVETLVWLSIPNPDAKLQSVLPKGHGDVVLEFIVILGILIATCDVASAGNECGHGHRREQA